MKNLSGIAKIEVLLVDAMQKASRWPIPESLIGRKENTRYELKVDDIMIDAYLGDATAEWTTTRQDIDAPYNTMYSDDDKLYHSSDDDEEVEKTHAVVKVKDTGAEFKFDLRLLDVSPFRMEAMKLYPYKFREGETPIKLLKLQSWSYVDT